MGDDGSAEGLVSYLLCFVCLPESVVEAYRNVNDVDLRDRPTRAAPDDQHVRGHVSVFGAVVACSRFGPYAPDQVGRDSPAPFQVRAVGNRRRRGFRDLAVPGWVRREAIGCLVVSKLQYFKASNLLNFKSSNFQFFKILRLQGSNSNLHSFNLQGFKTSNL